MDRISDLEDDVIRLIVRFLSAKDAASVLVLSRRFRNLYAIIQDLEFDETDDEFQGTFMDFVTGVLALLGTTTRIRRFSLKSVSLLPPDRINAWLLNVLNRSVMVVELCINGGNEYSLPSEIFACNKIVKLKLGKSFVISVPPVNASLPALETLVLDSVRFHAVDDCAFERLLSACPVLKELAVNGMHWETWKWSGNVCSQTLEKLTICSKLCRIFDWPYYQGISFDTPSLTYLDYSDYVPDAYPIVDFESLAEAKLDLQVLEERQWHGYFPENGDHLSSNATNLIRGLKNVKILELSSPFTFETFYFFREAIPVFENLHHLTLEDLHIGGPDYVCNCFLGYSCLLSCPVEVLEIELPDKGSYGELAQLKHFLGKLSCLELLKVTLLGRVNDEEKSRITSDLLMLPRASPRCRIEIERET